jgi:hypothetical protein
VIGALLDGGADPTAGIPSAVDPIITRSTRHVVTASGQTPLPASRYLRIRLAGSPGGRWCRCDRAERCEIVKEGEALTEEVAR